MRVSTLTLLSGLACTTAAWCAFGATLVAPPFPPSDRPSLWELTKSFQGQPPTHADACLVPSKLVADFSPPGAHGANDNHSCSRSEGHLPDGTTSLTYNCDNSLANHWHEVSKMRMEISADRRTIRSSFELARIDPDHPGDAKPGKQETLMVYRGECPVPMPPGQSMILIGDDGKPIVPFADTSGYERLQTAFASGLPGALLAADPKHGAKVVAVTSSVPLACGWAADGEAVEPFVDLGDFAANAQFDHTILFGARSGGSGRDVIDAAFARQAVLGVCGARMPARPAGDVADSNIDSLLAALWAEAPANWVIVPVPGGSGFVGVSRRDGGGAIQTPVFPSREKVQHWIEATGQTLADAVNAQGRAATEGPSCARKLSAAFGICTEAWPTPYSILPLH
jgi:hypothetical protein